MRALAGVTVLLTALCILPGWSFYYDVSPKAVVLLVGATLASILLIVTPRVGKWNAILGAMFAGSVTLSAALSPYVPLAWWGSNWRRSGALTLIAMVVIAVAAGAVADRQWLLRAICMSGGIAGAYAIAQYFGWDPLLPAEGYRFGEGEYEIVRPPGTMGHANYLGAFLLWPVFAGVALWRESDSWKWLCGAGALIGIAAIVLSGSRGAWAGLAAGAVALLIVTMPSWKRVAIGAGVVALAAAAFYASPAGERLRARMFWIGEDVAGGSRPLLWRNSLRLIGQRPLLGYGPEAFVAEFPLHQSAELSRAYPDFYHESPHNLFLDVLAGQGIVGLIVLLVWIGLALRRGWRTDAALFAALVGALVAHQFAVWVIPNALVFFVALVMLFREEPMTLPGRWLWAPVAVLLAVVAYRTAVADTALARVQAALDARDPARAADLWGSGVRLSGVSADLHFSRRWVQAAAEARDTPSKLRFAQLAGNTAAAATRWPEQRQNAFYNLAQIEAAVNDNAAVEASLRGAIAAAPTWFKPHWALARLLWLMGRPEDARAEARLALDLNGGRDAEVQQTLDEIVRSGHAGQ